MSRKWHRVSTEGDGRCSIRHGYGQRPTFVMIGTKRGLVAALESITDEKVRVRVYRRDGSPFIGRLRLGISCE